MFFATKNAVQHSSDSSAHVQRRGLPHCYSQQMFDALDQNNTLEYHADMQVFFDEGST
jgi:hypothetical protein